MDIDIYSRMYIHIRMKRIEKWISNWLTVQLVVWQFRNTIHQRAQHDDRKSFPTRHFVQNIFHPAVTLLPVYNPRNSHTTKFQSPSASCPVSPRFNIPRVPFDVSVSYQPFSTSITPPTDAPRTLGFPTPSPTPFAAPSSFSRHRRVPSPYISSFLTRVCVSGAQVFSEILLIP